MRDNTLLLSEMMHMINEGHGQDEGAVAIQVDNASAFDKVRSDGTFSTNCWKPSTSAMTSST
eukprot:5091405-Prymnesium_polylepis.1